MTPLRKLLPVLVLAFGIIATVFFCGAMLAVYHGVIPLAVTYLKAANVFGLLSFCCGAVRLCTR